VISNITHALRRDYVAARESIGRCLIVLPFQGGPALSLRFPRAALRCALCYFVVAFQASKDKRNTGKLEVETRASEKLAAQVSVKEPKHQARHP
jgi:hypothetical protein